MKDENKDPACDIGGTCLAPWGADDVTNCVHCGKELRKWADGSYYTWDADQVSQPRAQDQETEADYAFRLQEEAEKKKPVVEVRYLTDDRDHQRRNELVITRGGNGDLYIAVVPEGTGCIGKAVRICTSGGAASRVPGLGVSIARAFEALIAAGEGGGVTLKK